MKFGDALTRRFKKALFRDVFRTLIWNGVITTKQEYLKYLKASKGFSNAEERKNEAANFASIKASSPYPPSQSVVARTPEARNNTIAILLMAKTYSDALICSSLFSALRTSVRIIEENTDPRDQLLGCFFRGMSQGYRPYLGHELVKSHINRLKEGADYLKTFSSHIILTRLHSGNVDSLRMLCAIGLISNLNKPINSEGETLVYYIVKHKLSMDLLLFLIEKNADVSLPGPDGNPALFLAISLPDRNHFISPLLEAVNDIDKLNSGYSLLHMAVQCKRDDLLDAILRRKPKVDIRSSKEKVTPLWLAVISGQLTMAKKLIEVGNADITLSYNKAPLFRAVMEHQAMPVHLWTPDSPPEAFLMYLLKHQKIVRKITGEDAHMLVLNNNISVMKELASKGFDVNNPSHKLPLLFSAVVFSNFELIRYFVESCHANINSYIDVQQESTFSEVNLNVLLLSVVIHVLPLSIEEFAPLFYGETLDATNIIKLAEISNRFAKEFSSRLKTQKISPLMLSAIILRSEETKNIHQPVNQIHQYLLEHSGVALHHYFEIIEFFDDVDQAIHSILNDFMRSQRKTKKSIKSQPPSARTTYVIPEKKEQDKTPLVTEILEASNRVSQYIETNELESHIPNQFNVTSDKLFSYNYETLLNIRAAIQAWEPKTISRLEGRLYQQEVEEVPEALTNTTPTIITFKGTLFTKLDHIHKLTNDPHHYIYFDPEQVKDLNKLSKEEVNDFTTIVKNTRFCASTG